MQHPAGTADLVLLLEGRPLVKVLVMAVVPFISLVAFQAKGVEVLLDCTPVPQPAAADLVLLR